MNKFENILEKEVYDKLTSFLREREILVKYGIMTQPNLKDFTSDKSMKKWLPDFLILKGPYPFIVIEVTINIEKFNRKDILQERLRELELIGADYFVLTNADEILIYSNGPLSFASGFFNFFKLFETELTENIIEDTRRRISEQIAILTETDNGEENFMSPGTLRAKEVLRNSDIFSNISYNNEGRFFHFTNHREAGFSNFENKFFQSLLDSVDDKEVCRYTTLETMFSTHHFGTFRMGSVIAMNDRGEIDYADKYIGIDYTPLHSLSLSELEEMNKMFISSCTTLERRDNLTMYRLYAEDSKGVCISFDINEDIDSNFILKKISYARGPKDHPELDLLAKIQTTLKSLYSIRFRFLYFDTWKHFFKTHDYAIENEVRLLYHHSNVDVHDKMDWVITQPDRILSKYVLFNLKNERFPLQIKQITLGPNFPESYLNTRQLEVLASELNIPVGIDNSAIESYRKS